jgi:hypothetical protein
MYGVYLFICGASQMPNATASFAHYSDAFQFAHLYVAGNSDRGYGTRARIDHKGRTVLRMDVDNYGQIHSEETGE